MDVKFNKCVYIVLGLTLEAGDCVQDENRLYCIKSLAYKWPDARGVHGKCEPNITQRIKWAGKKGIREFRLGIAKGRVLSVCVMNMDMEMQLMREFSDSPCGVEFRAAVDSKHKFKLREQAHGNGENNSKDLNLLEAAYYSTSWKDFDSIFFEQESLLGNNVLHIAASCGDGHNWKVEEVAQHAHYLFFHTNSNGDSALHVAARAGHASTLRKLLTAFLAILKRETTMYHNDLVQVFVMMLMVAFTLSRNKQKNTLFHEAFLNGHNTIFKAFQDPFELGNDDYSGIFDENHFKGVVNGLVPFMTNNKGESVLYLAIQSGYSEAVYRFLDHPDPLQPNGKSPILAAIRKRNKDMINNILTRKPTWIHLRDEEERYPLHYAASIGYLEGVRSLVEKCKACTIERDIYGFFPLHLASAVGDVEVVKELLKCYPDPTEMLDKNGRNILHIAATSGKLDVVSYILQESKLKKLINQKDANGNTPLHLATLHWRPKVVYALTWDTRIDLAAINNKNQTALDVAEEAAEANPPLRQRLTWCALRAAGTPRSSINVHLPSSAQNSLEEENLSRHQNEDFSYNPVNEVHKSGLGTSISSDNESEKGASISLEEKNVLGPSTSNSLEEENLSRHQNEDFSYNPVNEVHKSGLGASISSDNESEKGASISLGEKNVLGPSTSNSGEEEVNCNLNEVCIIANYVHRIANDVSRIASGKTELSSMRRKAPNLEPYKDRIDTLIVVSTLIITVAFAAGFSIPGGVSQSSDPEPGAAIMLNHTMFQLFIFSDAMSFFGATGAAVILFWARLGDPQLLLLATKWAMPLLGVTLTTLSLAFLSAVYLIIGKLSWLAATFLAVGGVMALMVLSLYILLWLPIASNNLVMRYISHCPFSLLAWYAERGADGNKGSLAGYVKI